MKTRSFLLVALMLGSMLLLNSFKPSPNAEFGQAFKRSPETRANVITGIMKRKLELSDSQVEKAYQINLKYAQKLQPIVEKGDRQSWPSKDAKVLNKERKAELLAVLTPTQKEKVAQMREQLISRLEITLERLKEADTE
ncbi:hypothetical protein GM418_13435 [Maribellus comscasis]|uniref:Periplasmic heavy metal sensor n=1 Tax=Maribellus comscasis TaxID=2681766 RepID=A0A6I6JTR0_9BACT|nr:hypothetical protein [Maribellus comscasis]QGY44629.1 hypothetical protein GM418_13435 [Maribellus comscasis]